jgi:tRNA (adenine22-N1)-methyltransferase
MLSARLKRVYNRVQPGGPLWDIGCDHGYLGLHAFRSGLCTEVNLVDQSAEVLRRTQPRVDECRLHGPAGNLRVWHADAASEPLPITHGTVVIAGVGHDTALRIVRNLFSNSPADGVMLVLASAPDEERLRLGLARLGWRLRNEELYVEKRHVRQVLTCGRSGQVVDPFWNGSATSVDNGLLERFLDERMAYHRSCREPDGDRRMLADALHSICTQLR